MKFPLKKRRSSFRKIGSCASYASYASCASYADCASENTFHRLRRSPSLEEGGLGGFASSRSSLYNSGCRVATLLVSKGVMGFLGDLRGRNSKSPPNPLGLAERGYSFHRCGGPPPSRREVWGFALPLRASYTTPGAGHMKKISAQHPSPPLRRINQPFQRVDAAYALVIGGRVVVKRQNQFGV